MKRALGIAIMFALTAGLAATSFAQDKKQKDPNERKKKDELKSVYKDAAYGPTVDDMKKELKRLMEQYKDDGTTVVKYENPNPPMPKAKAKAKANAS